MTVADSTTGALIGAGILFNGWTVEYALRRFPTLAKKVFRRRKWLMALFCWLRDLGMAACYDGIYPAKQMEDALKEAFGVDQSIMDYSHAKSMGTKIGFPVATVHGRPSRRIFTNYNGTGAEAKNLGKLCRNISAPSYAHVFEQVTPSLNQVKAWEECHCGRCRFLLINKWSHG